MRKCLLFLFPFLFFVSCGTQSSSPAEYKAKIVSVHDGDTFRDANNQYRLFGVDTPEISNQYNGFEETKGLEHLLASEAKVFAQRIILNKEVNVHVVSQDPYNRVVARISIRGRDLASSLVLAGLARVAYISNNSRSQYYTNEHEYLRSLLQYQHDAYMQNRGIWKYKKIFKTIFPKS